MTNHILCHTLCIKTLPHVLKFHIVQVHHLDVNDALHYLHWVHPAILAVTLGMGAPLHTYI